MLEMFENKFLTRPKDVRSMVPLSFHAAVRPLLLSVPRAGDQGRPAAADVRRMRGVPLLRRRVPAGGAARPQARVPLPQAEGEQVAARAPATSMSMSPLEYARISRTSKPVPRDSHFGGLKYI